MSRIPIRLDSLRLRHLRLLELIDEHRSLRAVGAILNRTQPAVSQMLKDLEYAFGVPLVERSVRGVALNAAGLLALQRARSGLASFDHLVSELTAAQSPILRVGTNPALAFQMLPAALQRLQSRGEPLRLKVQTGVVADMLQSLWDGELDCYVGRVDWDQMPQMMVPTLRHDPLIETDLVVACSVRHPLATRQNVSISELSEWQWVLPPITSNNRVALETEFRNHGIAVPVPNTEIADPAGLLILARELDVLICAPRFTLDTHIAGGELCALDIPSLALPLIRVGFVTLAEHRNMAALQLLWQVLSEAAERFSARD